MILHILGKEGHIVILPTIVIRIFGVSIGHKNRTEAKHLSRTLRHIHYTVYLGRYKLFIWANSLDPGAGMGSENILPGVVNLPLADFCIPQKCQTQFAAEIIQLYP